MLSMKNGKIGNIIDKATLSLDDIAQVLFLCADALFYPEDDFFNILRALGVDFRCYKGKTLEDLQSEYINLFESSHGGIECVPYASWWYDKRLLGSEAMRVKKFYELCGFKFNKELFKMPWDHVAIELSFLSNLLTNGEYECATMMIEKHLDWLEKFKNCLKKKSDIYFSIMGLSVNLINKVREDVSCLQR